MNNYRRQFEFFIHNVIGYKVADAVSESKKEMTYQVQCYLIERDLIPTMIVKTVKLLSEKIDCELNEQLSNCLYGGVGRIGGVPVIESPHLPMSINGQDCYMAFNKLIVPKYTKVAV